LSALVVPPPHRTAWLEIDLAALRHNVSLIRSLSGTAAIAAVVKADAYGHGWQRVAAALAAVTDALCVATLDEAIALRSEVGGRVLLLYPVPPGASADAIVSGAELTIMSPADLQHLRSAATASGRPVSVQLCIETGLGRGGLSIDDAVAVAAAATLDERFVVTGVWSHVATPEDAASSAAQVARFEVTCRALAGAGLPVPDRHLAASGGIFCGSAPALEMVRPGLSVYGVLDEGLPLSEDRRAVAARLRPAMSLKARPVAISEVTEGERVGYGGRWQAERPSRIAILPVGYADGYLRGSQPGARALVRGTAVPVVGVISMDALAVDVTDLPGLDLEDDFVLLGRQGPETITAGDLARARNTISWEVLSSMAARLDRVYYP
jgi:alanine racemase